jgi:hypothetical protein
MSAFEWLQQNTPGMPQLTADERAAISDFSIFWSVFESRALSNDASAARILQTTRSWLDNKTLTAQTFAPHLAYFRERYFQDGHETPRFAHLNLRANDMISLVRSILGGNSEGLAEDSAVVLIVVYRFRNNLFHGIKWAYALQDQLNNFLHANAILMKGLELSGPLIG